MEQNLGDRSIGELMELFEHGELEKFSYEDIIRFISAFDHVPRKEVEDRIDEVFRKFGETKKHSAFLLLEQKYEEMGEDMEENERRERRDHARFLRELMHRREWKKVLNE